MVKMRVTSPIDPTITRDFEVEEKTADIIERLQNGDKTLGFDLYQFNGQTEDLGNGDANYIRCVAVFGEQHIKRI